MTNRSTLLALVALVATAGCVGLAPDDSPTTDSTASGTTTADPATTDPATTAPATTDLATTEPSDLRTTEAANSRTTVDVPPATDCGETWVSFYGVGGDVQDRLWDSDAVSVGYTVPGNASVFLVVYDGGSPENGTVLGVEHVEHATGYPVTADGHRVELDAALSGERTVSAVAHEDTDGDGEFDRTVDRACASGGELVRAGPSTFDFDEFGG